MRVVLLLAALCSSCRFDPSLDPGVQIHCRSDADCPGGAVCANEFCAGSSPFVVALEDPTAVRGNPLVLTYRVTRKEAEAEWPASQAATVVCGTEPFALGFDAFTPDGEARLYRFAATVPATLLGRYSHCSVDATFRDPGSRRDDSRFAFELDAEPPRLVYAVTELVPQAQNAIVRYGLRAPSAATAGTVVKVTLRSSEVAGPATSVAGTDSAGAAIAFTKSAESTADRLVFDSAISAGAAQGPVHLTAHLVDQVGNFSDLPIDAGVLVDTLPPWLDTEVLLAYVLRRAPDGTATDAGADYRLTVVDGGVRDDGTLLVLEDGLEVGKAEVGAYQPAVVSPVKSSRPTLDALMVDRAGNTSAVQRIRDVALTVNARRAHSATAQYQLEQRQTFLPARRAPNTQRVTLQQGPIEVTSAAAWTQLPLENAAPYSSALAFDSDRGVVVSFGGLRPSGGGPMNINAVAETWEWDGRGWRALDGLSGTPPGAASTSLAMVYDPVRQESLLFHGATGETWKWDGARWFRIVTPGPPARRDFAMVFDRASRRMLLYGGRHSTTMNLFSDTWEWDGFTWTEATPAQNPGPRASHALAYEPITGFSVLFGGDRGDSELWRWDSLARQWSRLAVAGTAPQAAPITLMAYDTTNFKLRILQLPGSGQPTATYQVDLLPNASPTWVRGPDLPPLGPTTVGVFDAAHDQLFLMEEQTRTRVKAFADGGVAVETQQNRKFLPGTSGALGFDPVTRQLLFVPGQLNAGTSPVWCWAEDTGWQEADVTGTNTAGRSRASLLPVAQGMLLHGGNVGAMTANESWLFTPRTDRSCAGTWSSRGTSGPTNFQSGTVSDGTRALYWGLGGVANTAALWDGAFSTPAPSNGPQPRKAALVWDPSGATPVIFAFGGSPMGTSGLQMTADARRSLDFGLTWTPLAPPASPPPPRDWAGLVYDEGVGRVVMFGGDILLPAGAPPAAKLKVTRLDGDNWSEVPIADVENDGEAPVQGWSPGTVAYDPRAQKTTVVTGTGEFWQLQIAGQRPMILFHADVEQDLAPEGVPVTIRTVEVSAIAGGEGTGGSGVVIVPWYEARWQAPARYWTTAPNGAPASAPAIITGTAQLPNVARQLYAGQKGITVAVMPRHAAGSTPAKLKLQWIELSIGYRVDP